MVFPVFFLWNTLPNLNFPARKKAAAQRSRCGRIYTSGDAGVPFLWKEKLICEKHIKKIFLRFRRENLFPKKVGRKPKRHKRVYKRAVCPFLGKEMLRNECAGDFSKKAAASCISLAAAWRRRRDSNPRSASHALLP